MLVRSVSAKREIRLQLDDGTVGSSPMKAARVFMLTYMTELTEKQRKIQCSSNKTASGDVESFETVRAVDLYKTCSTGPLNTESGNLQIDLRAWSEFGSRQDLLSNVLWTQDFGF